MISDFERRLADVLSARLPAPFTGRVDVPPGSLPGNGPRILVGVTQVQGADGQFGSVRPEVVPGANDPRRVLRLSCAVTVEVRAGAPANNRTQQMQGLEQVMYLLDAPDLRSGQALASGAPADPGFFIQSLTLGASIAPIDPTLDDALPVTVSARADGYFWPIGVVGQAGIAIGEIRLRGASLPLAVAAAAPLIAGAPPVNLTVQVGVGTFGTFALIDKPALPFGSLAFSVVDAGGRPGKGTLIGAVDNVRLVPLADNTATVSYDPPDEPAEDVLVVMLDDGAGGAGIEIGRAPLRVRGA
ncbi:MAG: hypothetical protein IPO91_00580 [Chloroflexi bacterium]|nr:hypothetical protein [Chloroflexota bacterium]